jgi:signal transduction histidine kinase/ActR/RegA family two-component response regulator
MWKEKFLRLFASDQPRETRFFNIIALGGMFAAVMGAVISMFTGVTWQNTIGSLSSFLFIGAIFWIANRSKKFEEGAFWGLIFLNVIVLPVIYYIGGGIRSGMSIWFTFGIIAIFLVLKGWRFYVAMVLALVSYMLTYLFSFLFPSSVIPLETELSSYLDTATSLVVVSVVIGMLYRMQTQVYAQQQKMVEEQNRKLEEANQFKGRFLASMSHEIRTPVNTIMACNELILKEDVPEAVLENATNIKYAGDMLLSLMNNVLDLSKLESQKMELVEAAYDTNALFQEVIQVIAVQAKEKKLDFQVQISTGLPSELLGDSIRVKQLMTNILTNAIKYTPSGRVRLEVEEHDRTQDSLVLIIRVLDTGIGIRKEDMNYLFDSFHRLEEDKNHSIEGSGLGLSISRQLVDLMGGTIEVESVYQQGSVFTISIPQKIINTVPVGNVDFTAAKKRSKADSRWQISAPEAKILVVDDKEMNLMVASRLLQSMGANVDTAYSGEQCLLLASRTHYNLIFMDHMMPQMDGIETLHCLREQENGLCRETPVVVMTANALDGAKQEYEAAGFQDYFPKPVNGKGFEKMLVKYLPENLIKKAENG